MNGFNRDPSEYGRDSGEFKSAREQSSFAGNPAPAEGNDGGTSEKARARRERRRQATLTSLAGFLVAATVAVAGTAAFASLPAAAEITAQAMHTSVVYRVEVTEGEDLDVVLYNDFVRFSRPLAAGTNSGVFEDLLSDAEYTVAVVGETAFGEKTVASTKVRTTEAPDPVTEWRGVDYECLCGYDGYFHFRMDFTDGRGEYSGFEASVTDESGRVSYCVFGADLHAEQRIDVADNVQLYGRGTFRLSCLDAGRGGERVVLCEVTFDI